MPTLSWIALASAGSMVELPLQSALAGVEPQLASGGAVGTCGSEARDLEAVITATEAAEGAIAYFEWARAEERLRAAEEMLLCQEGPVAANVAARVPYLRGVLVFGQGDAEAAEQAFADALAIRPTMTWDTAFDAQAQALFDQARAETVEPVQLGLLPPAEGGVWVDGRDRGAEGAQLSLSPGVHYVQLPERDWFTVRVELRADDRLLLPVGSPEAMAPWVEHPELGPVLAELLTSELGPELALTVDGRTWLPSEQGWTELPPPPEEVASPLPRWLALGGGALALSGGAVAAVAYAQHDRARQEALGASDWESYQASAARYELAAQTYSASRWVALGGAAVGGSGLVMLKLQRQREDKP
jgi:hypothetical protein